MPEEQLSLFDPARMPVDQVLDELGHDLRNDPRSWPTLLAELVDVIFDYLNGLDILDSDKSLTLAQDLVIVISHHLGGRSIYLPRDDRLRRAVRDAVIYRSFDGSNHLDLARKTGLTTTQIYNIISRQRRLRYDKKQMSLPFPE